jgi:hypothetical protein
VNINGSIVSAEGRCRQPVVAKTAAIIAAARSGFIAAPDRK